MADLTVVDDPFAWIARNEYRLFESGQYSGSELAELLVADARAQGIDQVTAELHEGWHIVHGAPDWLPASEEHRLVAFSRLMPFPEMGQNCYHRSVLCGAFPACAATVGPADGEIIMIRGNLPHPIRSAIERLAVRSDRVVAFTDERVETTETDS